MKIDELLADACVKIAETSGTFHLAYFPKAQELLPWGCTLKEGGEFVWGKDPDEAMQKAVDEYAKPE